LLARKATLIEINEAIDKITHKESILDTLIKKALKKKGAEKNNELRILQMSKTKYQKELQELMYRRSKLENQESKDVLTPGLCNIQISTSTIGYENGKPFAMYVIEVHRNDPLNPSGWVVARRYREFFDLHNKLRVKFSIVNDFDLPGKKMMSLFKLNSKFVEERRVALQYYLQLLLDNKDICRCDELREFLCQREQKYAGHSGGKGEGEFGDITQEPEAYVMLSRSLSFFFFCDANPPSFFLFLCPSPPQGNERSLAKVCQDSVGHVQGSHLRGCETVFGGHQRPDLEPVPPRRHQQ